VTLNASITLIALRQSRHALHVIRIGSERAARPHCRVPAAWIASGHQSRIGKIVRIFSSVDV
jgi:hypothetical protein